MSGKRHNEELEDKYASKAVTFKSELAHHTANTDQSQKMQGLESDQRKKKEFDEANKPKGLIGRKMDRIFGAAGEVRTMFFQGFKMGFIVGGIFGGLMGTYYAVVSRSILYIPTAAIASGCSFGFFMGIGMVMRTEMEAKDGSEYAMMDKQKHQL